MAVASRGGVRRRPVAPCRDIMWSLPASIDSLNDGAGRMLRFRIWAERFLVSKFGDVNLGGGSWFHPRIASYTSMVQVECRIAV